MLKFIILSIIAALFLSSCKKGYDDKVSAIENHFKKGRTGSYSSDYYLIKNSFAGSGKVAVIFGFLDNSSFCEDIATLYMKKYPADNYHCENAN